MTFFFAFSSHFRLSNEANFRELQFLNARSAAVAAAAAAAASAAAGMPTPGHGHQQTTLPSTHPADFHPAYRIPGYMEHLYSLQHATSPSASIHGI